MQATEKSVHVMIVGAGPVGLALAAGLARLGVSSMVIDKQVQGANTSRACVIHARTLEVLEPLGVCETLLSEAVRVPIFRIRDRDRVLTTIDFSELQTSYPFTLMYPQYRTEAILFNALEKFGGSVLRPAELASFEQVDEGVVTTITDGGTATRIASKWLVGCDGMHSRVRELAGIEFKGSAYQEGFVLADVQMEWPLSREEVSLFLSSQGLMVVAPLPMGHFRIVATDANSPTNPSLEYVQELLDARGPLISTGKVDQLVWSSRFLVHHRIADSLRKGRVLLCGDAAHVHSPAGGQGMNTGIQDAMSLAPVLAGVDQSELDRKVDQWVERRHDIARDVVSMTDRMTRMATLKSPVAQSIRNFSLELLGRVPSINEGIARKLAELDNR